jgi:cytochrome c biogenesis protein CcdA/thiol-disulfide isomerase/thioredoxin
MLLALALFAAGFLTILLPCILPLVPIVLGVSIAGQSRLRPLFVVMGMVASFVAFTFALHFLLSAFPYAADAFRVGTFAALFLFGVGFLTSSRYLRLVGAMGAALFFLDDGIIAVMVAAAASIAVMEAAGWVSTRIQQTGTDVQLAARGTFGADSPITALLIGLTLGLIWVPCAGPALGFAFALVRDEPGLRAALLLTSYALGTAVPLLAIGYGGQRAVRSVRFLNTYTGLVKRVAGVLLIVTAILLQMRAFERLQVWFVDNTPFGEIGTRLEEMLIGDAFEPDASTGSVLPPDGMKLPQIIRAPDWTDIAEGPWHNGAALTAEDLKGKIVLVDFWTYSCINCIRTLPYLEGYWNKYKDTGKFILVGVHTPEFAFEGVPENVQEAIDRHGLTYPTVQDNDYAVWGSFANRYWPAKYLIDADGYVRYTHFGEGDYEETDMAIASLLQEIGVETAGMPIMVDPEAPARRDQTPETYLGERSWPALQNAQGDPTTDVVTYVAPQSLQMNRYALVGDWQLGEGERQILRSATGEIRMKWQGSEINLVMGLEDGVQPVEAEAWIDGVMVKKFLIDRDDLFVLYDGEYGEHDLILKVLGPGAEAYAFTFGS